MKKSILFILLVFLSFSCKEKVVEYQIPKEFTNDLLHSDLIGKVVQTNSNAMVVVSQVAPVDSVRISTQDGSFAFRDLRVGNYDVTIKSASYRTYLRTNLSLQAGGITYMGEIDLSTIPDLVDQVYPANNSEVVCDWRYGRITVSMTFTHPMDRVSVEKAFSTNPPSEGIFYWGQYSSAPRMTTFYGDGKNGFDPGATITTYSKISSFTYSLAQKDCYTDTTYTITLSTVAKDTMGNHLPFPLTSRFKTVQSYTTIYGIQSNPVHGDVNVDPLNSNGIEITFPRRMDPVSTEAAVSVTPAMNKIFLWPDANILRIYTGGPFLSDTTISVRIDSIARDKDGYRLGQIYVMSFRTAPFQVRYTSPNNAQIFVSLSQPIYVTFNNYIPLANAQSAFSISPQINGSFSYYGTYPYEVPNEIVFTPSGQYQPNTKYTVTISAGAKDMYGIPMKSAYSFSFVTRPN